MKLPPSPSAGEFLSVRKESAMKQRSKNDLEKLVNELAWNDGFGCYTRAGFEKLIWPRIAEDARWIVFLDVDDMHGLNQAHGYEGVNKKIKKSLALRAGDYMAGQWFSGDEFIVCITDGDERNATDPIAFCERLAKAFRRNGASATFAIVPVRSQNLYEAVAPANEMVQASKLEGRRGSIDMAALDRGQDEVG